MNTRAWLQLFRAPNLFTVPGDPLAGFLIASGGVLDARVVPAIVASLCIYSAGLAMNDVIDLKEDLAERPKRPIPSGAISRSAAISAILTLCFVGIATLHAALGPKPAVVGVILLLTVWLYNFTTKSLPFVGALTMGTCRGISLVLGAVAAQGIDGLLLSWADVLPTSLGQLTPMFAVMVQRANWGLFAAVTMGVGMALYIAAVTNLARHETKPEVPRLAKMLPLAAVFIGYLLLKQFTGRILMDPSPTLWLVAVVLCLMQTGDLLKTPPRPIPPAIGGFIRLMLIMQAALCVMPDNLRGGFPKTPDSLLCAFALLAMVPLSASVGKKFYAS
jgi:hypothetical protein